MAKEIGNGTGGIESGPPDVGAARRDARVALAALLTGALVWGLIWYPYRVLRDFGIDGLSATSLTYLVAFVVALMFWRPRPTRPAHPWLLIGLALSAGGCNIGYVMATLSGEVMRVLLLFYLAPLWTVPLPEERARGLRPVAGGALVVGLEANEFVRLDETITPARDPPSIALPAGEVFDIDASAGRLRVLVGPDLDSRPVCDLLLVELDADGWTADTRCVLADLRMERGDRFGALLLPVADAALVLGRDGRATLHPLSGGPAIGALATALTGESIASEWSGGAWVPGIMHAARNESGSRVVLAGARGA